MFFCSNNDLAINKLLPKSHRPAQPTASNVSSWTGYPHHQTAQPVRTVPRFPQPLSQSLVSSVRTAAARRTRAPPNPEACGPRTHPAPRQRANQQLFSPYDCRTQTNLFLTGKSILVHRGPPQRGNTQCSTVSQRRFPPNAHDLQRSARTNDPRVPPLLSRRVFTTLPTTRPEHNVFIPCR